MDKSQSKKGALRKGFWLLSVIIHACGISPTLWWHIYANLHICKLAKGKITIFQLVSAVEETDLKLALSETSKTGFVATRPI